MIIFEHSSYDGENIADNLGVPEYSYWFVRKAFRPLLEEFGTIVPVLDPVEQVNALCQEARASGEACVLMSYNPPQKTPLGLYCPTIPVFAWEFDRIPDEPYGENPQEDWRVTLSATGLAVTHCDSSAQAVRRAMGEAFPIWTIPAPVFETGVQHRLSASGWHDKINVPLGDCVAIDASTADLSLFQGTKLGGDSKAAAALRLLDFEMRRTDRRSQTLTLSGVVYTTVLNPVDGRKNWRGMIAGFVAAFRHVSEANLILKLSHFDVCDSMLPMLAFIAKLGDFDCRVILIHGMLSDAGYAALVSATSFTVNTSTGEGQCLPLMEFMSAGRPAIAPVHTAMKDYISEDNSFVVASNANLATWPHDERQALRCLKYEIETGDLLRCYQQSFAVARQDSRRYLRMSNNAVDALDRFCSNNATRTRLATVFDRLSGCQNRYAFEKSHSSSYQLGRGGVS